MREFLRDLPACMLAGLIVPAVVQASSARYDLKIESLPLVVAIQELSKQTGLQIGYLPGSVAEENMMVAPLSGEYTVESVLEKWLAPRRLSFERINKRTIAIVVSKGAMEQWRARPGNMAGDSAGAAQSQFDAQHPVSDSSERQGRLEEVIVIVTAQKRAERLQDVPISMTVMGGIDLDKSTAEGVTEALNRVPGVTTTTFFLGGGTQLAVRGVAAGNAVFAGSSPVSYYLDSVPFGLVKSAVVPDSAAYDLARVEVLRRPQGTLYGANALNGVVRVLTEDAHPGEFELKARSSVSATENGGQNYRGDMAVNVPIIEEKLAARAVLGYQDLSGWIDKPNDKDANDGEIRNMRLKINAQPTDELSLGVSAWLSRTDYGAPPLSADNRRNPSMFDESMATDYDVYGLKIGYDFGRFSVVSMTSYLDYANGSGIDLTPVVGAGLKLSTDLDSRVFSQEIALTSERDGPWRWSAGAFYRVGKDRLVQSVPPGLLGLDYVDESEAYAVFGELRRRFFHNKLEWTLGLRHFHDDVLNKQNSLDIGQLPGTPLHHVTGSFESTTPRAALTWYPDRTVTAYVSYSEGFRSGFPQNANVDFDPLKPDKLRNYEVGAKADVFDGRVSFEAAVYYLDWRGVQQVLHVPTKNPNDDFVVAALVNGDCASGVGVDFAVTARPVGALELGVNFSWNDLTMDSDVFSGGVLLFAAGDRINYSPEYTVGASADYKFPLGRNGLEGRFSASANYTSKQKQRTILAGDRVVAVGDSMLIGRTSFAIAANRWEVTAFIDNVNNEQGSPMRQPFTVPIPDWDSRVRPRTLGMQLEYHF